ncbi:MAG: UDP-2,3-diacylglucosamine hydrolase, partial [Candidatus Lightella neohaematopini]|nr:UDP-2,3-diacylglucosamine hydrolase [Candidatus Lightella neohaematopini]
MTILFIADVHLSNDKPDIINHFDFFIKRYAINSTALYILGDLFESWIGDDYVDKISK